MDSVAKATGPARATMAYRLIQLAHFLVVSLRTDTDNAAARGNLRFVEEALLDAEKRLKEHIDV